MRRAPTYVSDDARSKALGPTGQLPAVLQALLSPSPADSEDSAEGKPWFIPLQRPEEGDWLDEHRQSGQSFAAFARKTNASRPTARRTKLLLVPVGTFPSSALDVHTVARIAAAFFDCPVILAKPLSIGSLKAKFNAAKASGAKTKASKFHRKGDEGQDQLHAGVILGELKSLRARDRRYADCFAVMGFTMVDLFPRDSWNFVYGLAFASAGAGIFSFARYRDEGAAWPTLAEASDTSCEFEESEVLPSGGAGSAGLSEQAVSAAVLEIAASVPPVPPRSLEQRHYGGFMRACARVLCHETCHLLGMSHCVYYSCLMNGSNHEEEACRRALRLCPVCLRKLAHCLRPRATVAAGRPGTDVVGAGRMQTKRLQAHGSQKSLAEQLRRTQSMGSLRRVPSARVEGSVALGRGASFKVARKREEDGGGEGGWEGAESERGKEEVLGEVLVRRYVRLAGLMGCSGMEEEAEWMRARVAFALRGAEQGGSERERERGVPGKQDAGGESGGGGEGERSEEKGARELSKSGASGSNGGRNGTGSCSSGAHRGEGTTPRLSGHPLMPDPLVSGPAAGPLVPTAAPLVPAGAALVPTTAPRSLAAHFPSTAKAAASPSAASLTGLSLPAKGHFVRAGSMSVVSASTACASA